MWLVHETSLENMQKADRLAEGLSAEQRQDYEARYGVRGESNPEIYRVVGEQANIDVSGVLTKNFSYIYSIFGSGSTAYSDIIAAIALAEADDSVKTIQMNISSGGGAVDGAIDAFNAVKNASKPVVAVVSGYAASAAYLLASAADKILATSQTDMFGSVGVVQAFYTSDYRIEVTNTASPDKRPDVRTEEGRKAVQAELDPIHDLLVDAIAEGRSAATGKDIDSKIINANFGKGGVFIAKEAVSRSMIDGFVESSEKVVDNEGHSDLNGSKEQSTQTGFKAMNKEQIKAQFPEVFASILADGKQEGIEAGVQKERERVTGHIQAAKGSGLTEKAFAAIEEGSEMTEASRMEHLQAGMNKKQAGNMADDNGDDGDAAATPDAEAVSTVDAVFDGLADDLSGANYA